MISKEQIKSEIEKVPEDRLEELYSVVRIYSEPRAMATAAASWLSLERSRSTDLKTLPRILTCT
jgi:hypothetical protein